MKKRHKERKTTTGPSTNQTRSSFDPERFRWGLFFLIAAGVLSVFFPSVHFEFLVWDDYQNIVDNPNIRSFSLQNLRWMFTTSHLGPYQPLSWISLALDYRFWKLDPFGYHLMNIFWHSINGACFFILILMLLKTHRENFTSLPVISGCTSWEVFAAFTGALLFALHPLRVESVVWATERRDVLCGFFSLLSFITYMKAADRGQKPPRSIPYWYLLSLVFFLLSLLAKAMSVMLAPVLVILDYYPLKRVSGGVLCYFRPASRRILLEKVPFFFLSLVFGLMAVRGQVLEATRLEAAPLPVAERIGVVFYGILFYLRKTLFPDWFAPFYGIPYELRSSNPWVYLSPVAVILITAALVRLRRSYPALLAVWLSYVVMLLPVSGLFQSGIQIAADRYSYLPTLGFFVLIGSGFGFLSRSAAGKTIAGNRAKAAVLLFVAVLAATVYQTRNYMEHWRNSESFWSLEKEYYPYEPRVYLNMGEYFQKTHRVDDAIRLYREAIRLHPDFVLVYKKLGYVYNNMGRYSDAVNAYSNAVRYDPEDEESFYNIGVIYFKLNKISEAVSAGYKAVELKPENPAAHLSLGVYLNASGRAEEAMASFRRAIQLRPDYAEAHNNLAGVLASTGDATHAEESYQKAIRIKPDYAAAYRNLGIFYMGLHRDHAAAEALQKAVGLGQTEPAVRNSLAWLYATSPDPDVRNGKKALQLAIKICEEDGYTNPAFLDSLAAAYAEAGDFEHAIQYQTRALQLISTPNKGFRLRLESYRKGRPWRESQ